MTWRRGGDLDLGDPGGAGKRDPAMLTTSPVQRTFRPGRSIRAFVLMLALSDQPYLAVADEVVVHDFDRPNPFHVLHP